MPSQAIVRRNAGDDAPAQENSRISRHYTFIIRRLNLQLRFEAPPNEPESAQCYTQQNQRRSAVWYGYSVEAGPVGDGILASLRSPKRLRRIGQIHRGTVKENEDVAGLNTSVLRQHCTDIQQELSFRWLDPERPIEDRLRIPHWRSRGNRRRQLCRKD